MDELQRIEKVLDSVKDCDDWVKDFILAAEGLGEAYPVLIEVPDKD